MKRKIIAFFIGTAFFIGAIGLGITSESEPDMIIQNSKALAESDPGQDDFTLCAGEEWYCDEYSDGTPIYGINVFWQLVF
ncbi:MAG: hypothetical protein K9I68_01525 [Bacteroidales bacterium]|nr:hypothetical protein [Bacteroidales bacterium]MCF8337067.1 hypothetical protein [Bacteroidales bacterium]